MTELSVLLQYRNHYCLVPLCKRYFWDSTEDEPGWTPSGGWRKTTQGFVCPDHVRVFKAAKEIADEGR